MEILLSHISDEEKLFEFDERSAAIGLPDPFGRITAVIGIYAMGQKYYAHGTIEVDAHLTCDVCLDEFDRHFEEHFEVVVDSGPEPDVPEEEEVIYISPKAQSVDFSDYVRDQLLLALPIQKRCRPDCKGLCPVCGANLNRENCSHDTAEPDPRWEKLRALKMKIENSEN